MKKIGILMKKFDTTFGISHPYVTYFKQFGVVVGVPFNAYVPGLDLLVLPGGPDLDTKRYGETPELYTGTPDVFMEWFDAKILPKYIESKTPIFGICRGLQSLNVLLGGSLHQHIWNHPTSDPKKRWEEVHDVAEWDSVENKVIPKSSFKTNSLHHQAIKDLGENLEITLVYVIPDKDRIIPRGYEGHDSFHNKFVIEGIKHKTLPIAACQFHCEETNCEWSAEKIKELLNIKK